MAALLSCSVLFGCLSVPHSAFAADDVTADTSENPALAAAQKKVTKSAEVYDEASDKVAKLEKKANEAQDHMDEIEAAIPAQQEKADAAMVSQYKFMQDSSGLLDMLMGSDTFGNFIDTVEYLNTMQEYNLGEITKLNDMKTELTVTKEQLDASLKEANEERTAAQKALEEAKALRKQLQEKALIEAEQERKAQEEAEKKQREAEKKKMKKASNSKKSDSKDDDSSITDAPALKNGEVNWDVSKSQFVSTWSKRIDAYLAGSPLSGMGRNFAVAAWNYGVDPRWSPAISCVESSKGAHCFKPYNAWGWGKTGWDSWEEAINVHVHGLATGYGYTVSLSAAQKYCPPNYKHWYSTCVSEMNKI